MTLLLFRADFKIKDKKFAFHILTRRDMKRPCNHLQMFLLVSAEVIGKLLRRLI